MFYNIFCTSLFFASWKVYVLYHFLQGDRGVGFFFGFEADSWKKCATLAREPYFCLNFSFLFLCDVRFVLFFTLVCWPPKFFDFLFFRLFSSGGPKKCVPAISKRYLHFSLLSSSLHTICADIVKMRLPCESGALFHRSCCDRGGVLNRPLFWKPYF